MLPGQLQVLHTSHVGRVYTYIVRGRAEDVTGQLEQFKPLMLEALASTVFITAARSKNPQNRAMRQLNAPTTA